MRDKYDFWQEDKHQSFLQAGGIVFTGHSQQYAKYPKQQVCNIFAISQKITEGWSWFFHADKHQTILQVDTINDGGHGQACSNYQNNKFAKSSQYLKKEVRDEVDIFRRWVSQLSIN